MQVNNNLDQPLIVNQDSVTPNPSSLSPDKSSLPQQNSNSSSNNMNQKNQIVLTSTSPTAQKSILKSNFFYIMLIIHGTIPFYYVACLANIFNTMQTNIMQVFDWTTTQLTLANSIVPISAILIQLFLVFKSKDIGRRTLLIWSIYFVIVGSALTLVVNTYILMLGRILQGFTLGIQNTLGPNYIREYSPTQYKGKTGVSMLFMFRIGFMITYGLGFGLPNTQNGQILRDHSIYLQNSWFSNNFWRVNLIFPLIIGVVQLIGFIFFFRFDTPSFIYNSTKDKKKTREILNKIYTKEYAEEEYQNIKRMWKMNKSKKEIGFRKVLQEYNYQLLLGLILTFSNTFTTGLTNVFANSNEIIMQGEGKERSAKYATLFTEISCVTDMIGVFVSYGLIERFPRKQLYLTAYMGLVITDFIIAFSGIFNAGATYKYAILAFRFFQSAGVGAVYWSYISDILPLVGVTIVLLAQNLFRGTALLTFFPMISSVLKVHYTFLIYGCVSLFFFIVLCFMMIETKGLNRVKVKQSFHSISIMKNSTKEQDALMQNPDFSISITANDEKASIQKLSSKASQQQRQTQGQGEQIQDPHEFHSEYNEDLKVGESDPSFGKNKILTKKSDVLSQQSTDKVQKQYDKKRSQQIPSNKQQKLNLNQEIQQQNTNPSDSDQQDKYFYKN